MRANPEEKKFSDFLIQIGNGEYPSINGEPEGTIELPSSIVVQKDIVSEIYGEAIFSPDDVRRFYETAILSPKNEHCDYINSKVIDLLPGKEKVYFSVNHLITENENEILQFSSEFLNSLELSGLPPHNLKLKNGAIVMLLRNMNIL